MRLWGTLAPNRAAEPQRLAVPDPALFAAHALYEALTRRGVTVAGRPVARHRYRNQDPPPAAALARADEIQQFRDIVGHYVEHHDVPEADAVDGVVVLPAVRRDAWYA